MVSRIVATALAVFAACFVLQERQAAAQDMEYGLGGPYFGIRAIGSLAHLSDTSTSGFAGPALVENDSDEVAGAALVGGWIFREMPLRVEVESGYRFRFDYDVRDLAPGGTVDYEMNVATSQVLVNAVFEFRNSSQFTPYLGGTVGWTRNNVETQRTNLATQAQSETDEHTDNLAFGALAGVNWRFAGNWSTDLMYRFIDLGEVQSGTQAGGETIESEDYYSHDVMLSVNYHF